MAEINLVPYIDVMLVLLIIFMVTAPLMTQGVHVELPQADAKPLTQEPTLPLIISVDRVGNFFLNIGEQPESPLADTELAVQIAGALARDPNTTVMLRGDVRVDYGRVMQAMVLAQSVGVSSVGLMTDLPGELGDVGDIPTPPH